MAFIDPQKQLALYTRDLLDFDEQSIKFGRTNHNDLDFSSDLIVVDGLAPPTNIGSQYKYDGESELQNITKMVIAEFTLNFYGDNALGYAQTWATLNESQTARNLGYTYQIVVHRASGITDLRMLTGSTYQNRFELTVKMSYNMTNEIELLNINSVELGINTDNPEGSVTIDITAEET